MATGRLPDPNTAPLTAKGDLYTYSTVPARLAVGSNGDTLVADSAATVGLRYQANFAAGKNKFINGDFGIWQRGTSFSYASNSDVYTADRWMVQCNRSSGTSTVTRESFTAGTAPVAGYESQFFLRITNSAGGTYCDLGQRIEDVRTFAGQTVTISFWAKASSSVTMANTVVQNFGSGGSADVSTGGTSVTLTSSWARYAITINVPSISGKTIGTSSFIDVYPMFYSSGTIASNVVDVWGVQIEAGSVATAFQTATGTLQGELAACQRYYWRHTNDFNGAANYTFGGAYSTTQSFATIRTPVTMRTAPTVTFQAASNYSNSSSSGQNLTNTSISISGQQTNVFSVYTVVSSGLTAGNATAFSFGALNNYYEASAEL